MAPDDAARDRDWDTEFDLGVTIPDDARELDADLAALYRERRLEGRRPWTQRIFATRRYRRYGLSGPLVAAVLVVVGVIGSLIAVLGPLGEPRRGAQPLAAGSADLLTPATLRTTRGTLVSATYLRPAVLALHPDGCDCAAAMTDVSAQARSYGLPLVVVLPDDSSQPDRLPPFALAARQVEGNLFGAYDARRLTLVMLRDDGTVSSVVRDVRTGQVLTRDLQPLVAD